MISLTLPPLLLTITAAAALSACMTWAILPQLKRYTLARPNERASHRIPTPQGAGAAVISTTLLVAVIARAWVAPLELNIPIIVIGATILIALLGLADDIKSIPVLPRLFLQAVAVGAIVSTAPSEARIVSVIPLAMERSAVFLAVVLFVNLVNFMDGLDLMTVAEVVPVTSAMVLLGTLGDFPTPSTIVAAALCGALVGFAPFNRPVAKVFLGDVGSLPIGLILGWCLLQLAWHQQLIAALLLPLYYIADAGITLVRRIAMRERFWAAHRTHFYQRATDNGFSVANVVSEVLILNIVLAVLAIVSVRTNSTLISILMALMGAVAVAFLLYRFSRKRPPQTPIRH
jgi:UDP-N-acetylmuramyl pentapeptide phosphotransferase/UDP-N-acetylglucosamine-1-phosphate transferase